MPKYASSPIKEPKLPSFDYEKLEEVAKVTFNPYQRMGFGIAANILFSSCNRKWWQLHNHDLKARVAIREETKHLITVLKRFQKHVLQPEYRHTLRSLEYDVFGIDAIMQNDGESPIGSDVGKLLASVDKVFSGACKTTEGREYISGPVGRSQDIEFRRFVRALDEIFSSAGGEGYYCWNPYAERSDNELGDFEPGIFVFFVYEVIRQIRPELLRLGLTSKQFEVDSNIDAPTSTDNGNSLRGLTRAIKRALK